MNLYWQINQNVICYGPEWYKSRVYMIITPAISPYHYMGPRDYYGKLKDLLVIY